MPQRDPKTCPHDRVIAEVIGMQKSGDYHCNDCGTILYPEDMTKRREERELSTPAPPRHSPSGCDKGQSREACGS